MNAPTLNTGGAGGYAPSHLPNVATEHFRTMDTMLKILDDRIPKSNMAGLINSHEYITRQTLEVLISHFKALYDEFLRVNGGIR